MEGYVKTVLAHLLALIVFYLLGLIAQRFRKYTFNIKSNQRTKLIKYVYIGKFLDFYLGYTRKFFFAVISFSILINLLGSIVLHKCQGLLFLDTIGTALSAFILGPWWGATVGLLTNMIGVIILGFNTDYHAFALVNCIVGILWGYLGISKRKFVTQLDENIAWIRCKSILYFGSVGVIASSLTACYILYYVLKVDTHDANTFHYTLYNYLTNKFNFSSTYNFIVFLLSEMVFNIPDKIFSVAVALVILNLVFPISKTLNKITPTINFIKLSSGSHLCFLIIYITYLFLMANPNFNLILISIPIVLCIISYLAMVKFIPEDLKYYITLAEYFQEYENSTRTHKRSVKFLKLAASMILITLTYFLCIGFFANEIGVWSYLPKNTIFIENFGVLSISLLFFLLALPSLFFLANNIRTVNKKLKKVIDNN